MIGRADRRMLAAAAGAIECVFDWPADDGAVGLAVVCHPHPLYGGTMDNKVAATLARTLAALGWVTVRFNFRGVGASAGSHDEGRGETDDLLKLIPQLEAEADVRQALAGQSAFAGKSSALALAGFSFGSFVAAQAAVQLAAAGRTVEPLILVGAAAGKWPMPAVPAQTLVVHGELDDTIPLGHVLQWAAPLDLPVVVIPAADHFFHRRLTTLKRVVVRNLLGSQTVRSAAHSGGISLTSSGSPQVADTA